jgi:hypothetical protein
LPPVSKVWSSASRRSSTTSGPPAGNLASLTTTDKSSLVAAINELKAAVLSAVAIDDSQIATTSTYSSNKIVSLLDALKADILGGADAAYDTLVEIQQLLQNGTTVWTRCSPPSTSGCASTRRRR